MESRCMFIHQLNKYMRKSGLILYILISVLSPLHAQFSMEGYLSNSVQAVEIKSIQNQLYFIDQHGFRSPILREVEFRMRASRFSEGLDDYKLRFSPINPYESGANRDFKAALEAQMTMQLRVSLNEVLKGRYQLMIEHYFLYNQQKIFSQEIEFYEDVLAIARKQPQRFSMKDIIRIDKSLLKASLSQQELKSESAQLEYLILQTYAYEGDISWAPNELAGVEDVEEWLRDQNTPDVDNYLLLQNEKQKQMVAESEFRVKKQESFSNIGYLQAEYRKDEDRTFGQNIGMQLAVSIPIVNPDKPDLERRRLGMLEDVQDFEEEKASINTAVNFSRIQLLGLIEQYNVLNSKKNAYLNYSLASNSANASLDMLIELREFQFELQTVELSLYVKMLEKYIELLGHEGKLADSPYVNYLSRNRDSFSIEL